MTETHRLVYTRYEDGGVSVCHPAPEIISYMTAGGGYWGKPSRGFTEELIRRKTCPILQNGHPCSHEAATKMVHALSYGGCTTAEAWGIIRDHDCARFGYQVELYHISELPDRWFRDAWYRSGNGGPVGVRLPTAQGIQWRRIRTAIRQEEMRRSTEIDEWSKPVLTNLLSIERAIRHARDESELRRVWPEGIPCH